MALVQIRNANMAHGRTVIAGEALKSGMVVKMVQGAASGDPVKVMKVADADLADATVLKGIVTFIQDNDLTVDFILDPADESLTVNTEGDNSLDIPADAQCVFWYGKPVVGLHSAALDSTIDMATIREGAKVAVNAATSKIGLLVATAVDANRDQYLGTVYQHEGAELTIICDTL